MQEKASKKFAIGLLVGVSLLLWTFDSFGDDDDGPINSEDLIAAHDRSFADSDDDDEGSINSANLIAAHDRNSRQYDRNCTDCHADIFTRQSLDPTIPDVHVAMFPFTPGEGDNDKCVSCHRTVDLAQGTQREEKSVGNLRKHVDAAYCTLCHGPSGPGLKFYQVDLAGIVTDGAELYELTCSACHGDLTDSEVEGESAREIQEKIVDNEGGMGPLRALSAEQIQAIAAALGGDTTLPPPSQPPPGTDGVALYAQSCAGCHGALANSEKIGRTAGQIQAAIDTNNGGMGAVSFLTTQEIQAIAFALQGGTTLPPPSPPPAGTDGVALYTQSCADCHGALANSEKTGRTAGQIQAAIDVNDGGMGTVSFLTTQEIQAIAFALQGGTTLPPPSPSPSGTDGVALYTQNCADCHRDLANSEVTGKPADKIREAIDDNKGGMGALDTLTIEQVDAIAIVLAQVEGGDGD